MPRNLRETEIEDAARNQNFYESDAPTEAERRYRDFIDNSLALFCTHDLDGVLLSVNPAVGKATGYTSDELIGQHLSKFVSNEIPDSTSLYLEQIKTKGESRGLMRVVTKTGEKRVWSYSNVRRTDTGGRQYVLGSAQDITELKNNEEELIKSRQMFESFMNHSPAMIFLKDEEGRFVFVNEPFEKLFQIRAEDLIGNSDCYYLPKEVAEKVRRNDLTVLETEQPLETVEIVPTPDGAPHYWLSNKFLIKDDAGKKLVGGIAVDITERKQMEAELRAARDAALEAARLKSAFLTNVSHEIRTPLNGVIGMTELLLDTPLDRAQRDCADTIRQSADALLTVINDILDLAKIESGKLRFEAVDFDVREVVESTVEMLAERAYRKNIEIASLVAADVPRILRGDAGRLRQVLTNLIGNAVKFTESGEVGVWANVEKECARSLTLRFTITDTGIGIAGKDIKNLFQPFIQIDDSTTRQYGGTGLGLVISKQIVEMMNGEFSVESEPDKGSRFSFTASFVRDANSAECAGYSPSALDRNEAGETAAPVLDGKRILITDASPIIRQTLGQYSLIRGLIPGEAGGGEQTLELLREAARAGEPFDFVVLDMNLPDWEGFSLARRIKSDGALGAARIILTTAYGQRGDGALAQNAGVSGYLTKPIRGAQFFDCLAAVSSGENKSADGRPKAVPLVTRHSLREAKSQAEFAPVSTNLKSFPILVAEDNEVNRRLIARQLEQIGAAAEIATDGQDALEKLSRRDYRLIFMDCQMPRLDGYQATREIRRLEREKTARGEEFSPLVIIALTAHTLAGEREKCLAAGMNDYLSKPVKVKELAAMLDYWSQTADSENTGQTDIIQAAPDAGENPSQIVQPTADFDPQPLRELAENGDDANFAAEIFSLYLKETAKRIAELKEAAKTGDGESAARIAHAIRGNSLAVGAAAMARTAKRIQGFGSENKIWEIRFCLENLEREFSRVPADLFETNAKP